jgi:LDH2 family malate/lactate/ureidoglycolate dehydrogenase
MNNPSQTFPAPALLAFAHSLLTAAGLTDDRARDVAEILLEGDLLGHTTHGLALLPSYLAALENGSMEKHGEPITLADHGSSLTWNGRYLPGPWLMRRAIDLALERIAQHPVVTISIRQSHHIACLQAFLKPVTDRGLMILLASSDPNNRAVAPHGGVAPRFSPDPLAAGIPTNAEPILIDISASTTANGVAKRHAAAGEKLPGKWLIDRDGHASDDPQILAEGRGGSLMTLGGLDLGHKGFALALLVEALTSALAGFGRADPETRWGASVFLQILDPAAFGGREAFLRETTFLARACQDTPVPPGKPPVRIPGQGALARRARQLAHGVELHPTIMPMLLPWSQKFAVTPPTPI